MCHDISISEMTDPKSKRRWFEFSLQGMLTDWQCLLRVLATKWQYFVHFATLTRGTNSEPERRCFQFSLRGLLLVFSLFALSFGLLRKACLIADAGNVGDDSIFVICFGGGLQVFVGTIGAVIERLIDSRRRGTVGVLISIALVWSFVWFAYVVGTAMSSVAESE
jgi:hypothetical protein